MAIGRSRGPRVIAVGQVERVRELPPRKDTGEIWATDVTLRDDEGAQVFVRFYAGRHDDALKALRVGELGAMWAEAQAGNRGEDLVFSEFVTTDDLDRINSGINKPEPVKA